MNKEEIKSCVITGLVVFIITTILFVFTIATEETKIVKDQEEVNWTLENGIKSISCYNLDGTGPTSKCKSKLKCFTKEKTNGDKYETECPMHIKNSNKTP